MTKPTSDSSGGDGRQHRASLLSKTFGSFAWMLLGQAFAAFVALHDAIRRDERLQARARRCPPDAALPRRSVKLSMDVGSADSSRVRVS